MIFAVPLAIAAQNIGFGAATLIGSLSNKTKSLRVTIASFRNYLISLCSLLLVIALATTLNPKTGPKEALSFLAGYIFLVILPPLVSTNSGFAPLLRSKKVAYIAATTIICWAAIVVSQSIFGWRIVGSSIVDGPLRPQGFYSHPLTLAYAALILWPFALFFTTEHSKNILAWLTSVSLGAIIFLSESRTAIATAALIAPIQIFFMSSAKRKMIWLGAFMVGGLVIVVTPNRISERIRGTIEGTEDRTTDYPDDRLGFWHAHWEMIKEKPLLGHGSGLNTAYRTPYYERIGLADMTKKYEAHNVYIQLLANGGVVGLLLFLLWTRSIFEIFLKISEKRFRGAFMLSLGGLLFASLTQNSFQDAEVRNTLLVVVIYASSFATIS